MTEPSSAAAGARSRRKTGRRLFVCDPVCVQALGHNLVALKYFGDAFASRFDRVVLLSAAALPPAAARSAGVTPFYQFYYDRFIPQKSRASPPSAPRAPGVHDPLEAAATDDARRIIETYRVGPDDTLLFPSIDFYAALGLVNVLTTTPVGQRPAVFIRFIGVMETATHYWRDPLSEMLGRLREALANGVRMSFSAETPKLADWMAERLGASVVATSFPSLLEPMPMPEGEGFTVYCPGSARHDKGFMDLLGIFRAVRMADPELRIRFVSQTLTDRDAAAQQNYISQLYALPGVELLPPMISEAEMARRYRQCSAVLMPYATDVYAMRGSAVMMEAAALGRPCVTLEGTAFAEQVRYYGLGTVVRDIAEMPRAILDLARTPRDRLQARAEQARSRLLADTGGSYDAWLKAAP